MNSEFFLAKIECSVELRPGRLLLYRYRIGDPVQQQEILIIPKNIWTVRPPSGVEMQWPTRDWTSLYSLSGLSHSPMRGAVPPRPSSLSAAPLSAVEPVAGIAKNQIKPSNIVKLSNCQ